MQLRSSMPGPVWKQAASHSEARNGGENAKLEGLLMVENQMTDYLSPSLIHTARRRHIGSRLGMSWGGKEANTSCYTRKLYCNKA